MAEEYDGATYYYTPDDAFCPYLNPTREVFDRAPQPFFMFNIVEESPFGVEMVGGRNVIVRPHEWSPEQTKEVRRLDRLFQSAQKTTRVVPGHEMTVEELRRLGGAHFERYGFHAEDLEAFQRYAHQRELLVVEVLIDGEPVFVDVSVTVPEKNEVCGVFCDWSRKFQRLSPGIYACVVAAREIEERWGARYNVGHEYRYKRKIATAFEKTYGVALVPEGHALLAMPSETNPVNSFRREDLNQVMRAPVAAQ
jgi:hypothetical protein